MLGGRVRVAVAVPVASVVPEAVTEPKVKVTVLPARGARLWASVNTALTACGWPLATAGGPV
jgi:hypothetical protein